MTAVLVFAALVYLQGTQSSVDPVHLVEGVDQGWMLLAVLAAAASYPAATMGFLGFVPERIGFGRASLAQLAGSFVRLVAPGGFGGVALNTRLLLRAGIAPGPAASSVGAGALIGLVLHLGQLAFFLWLTGFRPDHRSSDNTIIGWVLIASLAVLVLLVLALLVSPTLRRWALRKLVPLTEGALSRLWQLARHPRHLAVGVIGQVLISMALVSSLYCCVRATGGHPSFATVAVAYLLGNAIGSAVPTPAGFGGVELATAALLAETTGLGNTIGPVVLFRIITVLLPVLPGWLAFGILQRNKAL
ncbi:lysylphosphatidylglycerol synthase transmembrane domain-containing protein [Kitasatospora viridis]|uniref:lysylphosphatidylglycerol synthase transmembrane domain-containing protein n=1 Tax=Kitasatospora viridis TaxID=281105 RepID=UPI001478EAC6|nr:lysylphosphatidylglycerol synthase transmembrane domain-containing protein [Kitasatospora viridis]